MVSIIVPAFNSEKTIVRCVDSILKQSYYDIEVLLVDDGSTDKTSDICDNYAKLDPRILVYHKSNGGVSSARNLGLKHAKGEFITFIDSDDWVGENYISNLLTYLEQGVDLVISYNWYITEDKKEQEKYPTYKIDSTELFQLLFIENDIHYHTSPWGKLYRKSIIDDMGLLFDDQMHIGEDLCFLYEYMLISESIFISSHTDYYYVADRAGSLTKRVNSIESELHSYDRVRILINRIVKEKNITDKQAVSSLYWIVGTYVRRVLNSLYYNISGKPTRLSIIKNIDLEMYIKFVKTSSWKEKVYKLLLKMRLFCFYDFIRTVVIKYSL